MRILKALGFALGVLAVAGGGTLLVLRAVEGHWPWVTPRPPDPEFVPERHILPQEPFEHFSVVPAAQVKEEIDPAELVLGVTVGGKSRAYPLNRLSDMPERKVVNDTLGGQAIAATWCDACHSAIVYSRVIEGRTLTLAVAGQLWRDSMVLYDRETGTRWSQLAGEAKVGPLQGTRLRRLPSVVTDWASWRLRHPAGSVLLLPTRGREFRRDFYRNLADYVLGIDEGGAARAWGLDVLRQKGAVNDEWNGRPVVAVFDPASSTAALYERTLPTGVLTFRSDGTQVLDEQGGTWDAVTGTAQAGPHRGQRLRRLPAILATRKAWDAFHPPGASP